MKSVWKPGRWGTAGRGKLAVTWWRWGVAAKGEPSTVTQVRTYATEAERFDAVQGSDKPWELNRAPFLIDEDGLMANGVLVPGFVVKDGMSELFLREATEATNHRFGNVLAESEHAFGKVTEERYEALIETFIERIVKAACEEVPS